MTQEIRHKESGLNIILTSRDLFLVPSAFAKAIADMVFLVLIFCALNSEHPAIVILYSALPDVVQSFLYFRGNLPF